MPLWPPTPHICCGSQRERKIHSWCGDEIFYDNLTISLRGNGACSHGRSRPHHAHTDNTCDPVPLHTLPLTTLLAACCVFRCWVATSILLEQLFQLCARRPHVRAARGDSSHLTITDALREPSTCSESARACGVSQPASLCMRGSFRARFGRGLERAL